MSKLAVVASFVFGAAAGATIAWKIVDEKYKRIRQEEIDSIIKEYDPNSRRAVEIQPIDICEEECETPETIAKKAMDKPDVNEYAKKLSGMGYTNYSNTELAPKASEDGPYIISPDEFGEYEEDGYENVSLTYYADKVLTDDHGDIVEDFDILIGLDALNHFGEYEEDSVFVRNDDMKIDYEILLDMRKYSDVCKEKSRPRG